MRKGIWFLWLVTLVTRAHAYRIGEFEFNAPEGWRLHQAISDGSTKMWGFEKPNTNSYVRWYLAPAGTSLQDQLSDNAVLVATGFFQNDLGLNFDVVSQRIEFPFERSFPEVSSQIFSAEYEGWQYYGFSRADNETEAKANAQAFLNGLQWGESSARSLTDAEFVGKKYYVGWGTAASGDPSNMQNEVKYDVLHTHDMFVSANGGNYLGTKLIGTSEATSSKVRSLWQTVADKMTWNDMYVQYSSGHGMASGLGIGLSYNEIRDNALSYPAKEIVVFMMACESGGMVNAFNSKKDTWKDWNQWGRTLFVMASSPLGVNSQTGPGKDPDEPSGPNGSAGSAFGWALWKSLIGYADGGVDGMKDQFISLDEIIKYTVAKTKSVGGHTPVYTGAYNANLVMNRVPSKAFVQSLGESSEGLSDEQIRVKIQALDKEWLTAP